MVAFSFSCDISRAIVKLLNYVFLLVSIGIMGFGGFVFLLSLLGIFAVQEREDTCFIGDRKCMMGLYTVSLTILIFAQIAAAVLVIVAESDAEQFLSDRWNDMKFEQQVDIMEEFECGPFSPTFGEHLFVDEEVEDSMWSEEALAQMGMIMIEIYREVIHPIFNSTDNTTICRVDEIIEELGEMSEFSNSTDGKPIDVCFQDCYENFKDEFLNLGVAFIALVVTFACMYILLVASFCALCDEKEWQPDEMNIAR